MTARRVSAVAVGDEVRIGDRTWRVARIATGAVELNDVNGAHADMSIAELLSDPSFSVVASASPIRAPIPPRGFFEALPREVADAAREWEKHVTEVLRGVPAGAPSGTCVRLEYDPARSSLRQRQIAKVAELFGSGTAVSLSTFERMCRAYEREGIIGLVDGRTRRRTRSNVDPRVEAATRKAIAEETNRSTGTVGRLQRRVEQILAEQDSADPGEVMPSRATFYRLVERLSGGRHTFGSAPTRRSLAQQPDGPFGSVAAVRPGEWLPVDSTPFDVRVVLDDGTVDRAELTWMIDVATRSIPAAVLRPTTKTVDASLLLARCVTPEPMRPGWPDALRMSRSVLPFARMLEIDARLEHAAARPVIVPETIVCDHGMVYQSASFRAACRAQGVNFQPTHEGSPWEKGVVERTFASVASLFAQYVKGYVGRSIDRRGRGADGDAAWPITELQALLDEWIVAHWQNRPHDGLRHPLMPGRALTPNEMYAVLVEVAGYFPVPLSGGDYIELLPVEWRAVNSYGITINHRRYDARALNPYRRMSSGVSSRNGRWEVHYDPYDVSRVWIRNHHDGGWITAMWTYLNTAPAPFGETAWRQAQQILARRGQDPTNEADIAAAVAALLDKAEAGPATPEAAGVVKRDKRVAARTRAASAAGPAWPRPADPPDSDAEAFASDDSSETAVVDEPSASAGLAKVIPLAVFDAREEAKKWW